MKVKKKTLLASTLAGTVFLAGLTVSGVNAATKGKVIINEKEAKVVAEVSSETYKLEKADLEAMIKAAYESKGLADVTVEVEGETAGTGAKVKLENNLSETKELTVIVPGDVTGDGEVGLEDLQQMRLSILGQRTFEGDVKEAAKVINNEDGEAGGLEDLQRIRDFMLEPAQYTENGFIEDEVLPEEDIKVHEHKFDEEKGYTHIEETNQHKWTCEECEETVVEDCTFDEWNSEDGKVATRSCTKCENKEEKTLQDILNDASITEFTINKVDTTSAALTIPVGKTLTVSDTIKTGNNKITVNGELVLKTKQTQNIKLDGTGIVVYAPEVADANEFGNNIKDLSSLLNKIADSDKAAAKSLKYKITLPELEEPQTINEENDITIEEGFNLTVDLGKNILKGKNTGSTSFIISKGDLTLKNGKVEVPAERKKATIDNSQNTTSTLNLENVDVVGHIGVSTNGKLVMTGGTIESTGTDTNSAKALQIYGDGLIKSVTTELNDVKVKTKTVGIYIDDDPFHDLEMNGGSIDVTSDNEDTRNAAIWSNSQYSSITLDGTKITSEMMGIYLQNGGNDGVRDEGGNVAHLKDVTIESKGVCIWTCAKGDKVEVTGGSYISTDSHGVRIYSSELNTFEDCRIQGKEKAIYVLGSLLTKGNFSDYAARTNVTEIDL